MNYFDVAIILVAFFIGALTYRQGFKDGLAVSRGKDIPDIKNPIVETIKHVQEVKETKESKEASAEIEEGILNILSYNGEIQRKG